MENSPHFSLSDSKRSQNLGVRPRLMWNVLGLLSIAYRTVGHESDDRRVMLGSFSPEGTFSSATLYTKK